MNYYHGQYAVETYINEDKMKKDYLPEGSVLVQSLNDDEVDLFGLGLFDSGSTTTLINKRSVPPNVVPKVGNAQSFTTTQGTYKSSEYFMARNIFFQISVRHVPYLKFMYDYSIVHTHGTIL